MQFDRQLGKVVKSNTHCDYVVQLDDKIDVDYPPKPMTMGLVVSSN